MIFGQFFGNPTIILNCAATVQPPAPRELAVPYQFFNETNCSGFLLHYYRVFTRFS